MTTRELGRGLGEHRVCTKRGQVKACVHHAAAQAALTLHRASEAHELVAANALRVSCSLAVSAGAAFILLGKPIRVPLVDVGR